MKDALKNNFMYDNIILYAMKVFTILSCQEILWNNLMYDSLYIGNTYDYYRHSVTITLYNDNTYFSITLL